MVNALSAVIDRASGDGCPRRSVRTTGSGDATVSASGWLAFPGPSGSSGAAVSPGGTAKGDEKEAEEVMNGAPFISQWSFLVTRSSSSSQELAVDGYLKAPPFITASLSFFVNFHLYHHPMQLFSVS